MAAFDRHRILNEASRAGGPFIRSLGRRLYSALRRATFALSARGRGRVVFAGDSLIEQWTTLAEDFPSLKTVNRGVSGDGSAELLERFREDVLACRPRAVVMLIGTNDLARGASPAAVAERLEEILALSEFPVVVCRVLPRSEEPGRFPEKIRELNALIDRLPSGRPGVAVCDAFTPLADDGGAPRERCFTDGLHLSSLGYGALKAALEPHLREL
jgi:lysophospholipase L1-like esterase